MSCVVFTAVGLVIVAAVLRAATRKPGIPVADWFFVEFDSSVVRLDVRPPGGAAWKAGFSWSDIQRVCFKAEDHLASDGIYVFTRVRPESFAIPIEARGGQELWNEMIRRRLFDPELAIKAASAVGTLSCWPPDSGTDVGSVS